MRPSRKHVQRKGEGFSIIVLLVAVALIPVISVIAIPNLLRARISANEAPATSSMRTIGTGELMYVSAQGVFTTLSGLSDDHLIDNLLGTGAKGGHRFAAMPGQIRSQFTATAAPRVSAGFAASGNRFFWMDETQLIRFEVGVIATSASNPLGEGPSRA